MIEGPTERKLKEMIGIAVGEASMCWTPRPGNQVFDSSAASAIVDRLTCDVLQIIATAGMSAGLEEAAKAVDCHEKCDGPICEYRSMAAKIRELASTACSHQWGHDDRCVYCDVWKGAAADSQDKESGQ